MKVQLLVLISIVICATILAGVGVVQGELLRDPGFDSTWKRKNDSEAQRGWQPFVNGFHPSTNPKLSGTASLGISSTWPAGAFQFVPSAHLPPAVRDYTFAAWTLVDFMYAEKAPPTDGLGKVTIDVAYVSGRSDSFSADISGKTERSGHSLLEAAGQDNEEGWAAQRYMVWKEDWQQHCFALTTDATEEVESITVFLLSTHQPDISDTVQLWVEQADLFPSREYAATASDVTLVTHLSLDQLSLLSDLASYWKGPISAAVLLPNQLSLGDLVSAHNNDPALKQWATLHATYPDKVRSSGYPSGFLRKAATDAVTSTYVLQMDVNYRTEDSLRSDAERFVASLDWTNEDAVYVVPSFAVSRPLATATIPIDKKVLLQHLLYGRVSQVLLVVLVRGGSYLGFYADENDKASTLVPSSLYSPFLVLPKARSRFDDTIEGRCGLELEALKVELDMTGHAFMYLPRGHALRLGAEPSEQACASTDLAEWRAWYAWLVSTAIAHHTSPDPYRHLPVGDPLRPRPRHHRRHLPHAHSRAPLRRLLLHRLARRRGRHHRPQGARAPARPLL
ncbi:uncharacterized protein ACA1_283190 [Acanthamoeba castellanii str. Neff]|uniref:Uncharacterized protein n=1 Tax=Acanthamoeba castellanii (strain ATCC 30010 / Neff) TaxID=1257118 RepID=L8H7C7_ACACF|nr:uncharacterized protein ACA1_283190 [Acanthamoeba castellanii str. Neff]ELR21122.1 hypothetical protein ACA1_283190 [Acanthamoeba castellanii str. Neff]